MFPRWAGSWLAICAYGVPAVVLRTVDDSWVLSPVGDRHRGGIGPGRASDKGRAQRNAAAIARLGSVRRILIVDDEPALREILAAVLADEGYAVQAAADGRSALDLIAAAPPDLVITDISMPRLDGWGLLRRNPRGRPHVARAAHQCHSPTPHRTPGAGLR